MGVDLGYDVIVMITGLVLVFFILVLLMLIIQIEGKFFESRNSKGNAPKAAGKAVKPQAKPAAPAAKAAAPVPEVEQGISGEIVAAIAAAIAAISGGKYTLRAVRRAGKGRGSWGSAGVNDVTSPF